MSNMQFAIYDVNGNGPALQRLQNMAQQGFTVNNVRVVGPRRQGHTALSGTLAAAAAGVALNTVTTNVPAAAAAPTQAEFNALVTAYNAQAAEYTKLAANYRALHDSLRAHGLINN